MGILQDELITQNMNLAYKIANQYYKKFGFKIELDELQSLAFIGLTKAAQVYDETRDIAFSTFAYTLMRNEILLFFKSNKRHMKTNKISIYESIGDDIYMQDIIKSEHIDDDVEQKTQVNQLKDYIKQLSPLEQEIINRKLKGYTSKQVAEQLNLSMTQVNNRYRESIYKLRRKFKV